MSDFDWLSGTPSKLKVVALDTLEKKFASIVDELVKGNGQIRANITSFEVEEGMHGGVSLNIKLSREIDISFSEKK